MWITNAYLQEAISKKNYIRIRNELCSIIHKDPIFHTGDFETALQYVKRYIPDVVQVHDNLPFSGREHWDDEYWALVVSELMDNFSMERIEHVKQIGRHLHGWSAPAQGVPQRQSSNFEQAGAQPSALRSNVGAGLRSSRPVSSASQPQTRAVFTRSNYSRSRGTAQKKIGAAAIAAGVIIAGTAAIGFKKTVLLAGAAALIGGAYLILKSRKR
ncbi:hypothetical protein MJ257_12290 [Paenibacillus timonensis]|uniref:Uncharacterized protein n=1 Tax=Paenibacillus timonensis TaxID=225915 RepID=A0ABW3SCR9_9BACL|nr:MULTISPECIES: hypothetical protein [Paenibacillus]MCH1640886.1 hypothetical protein [Paenibacillus timonensis]MDU2239224.1 hypothetical protein [Paenibacillus sp.]